MTYRTLRLSDGSELNYGPYMPELPHVPLSRVRPDDVVFLPKRVSGILVYDPAVTVTRVLVCGDSGGMVICWEGGERLYTAEDAMTQPAILAEVTP